MFIPHCSVSLKTATVAANGSLVIVFDQAVSLKGIRHAGYWRSVSVQIF
jgi:hypothetical protein